MVAFIALSFLSVIAPKPCAAYTEKIGIPSHQTPEVLKNIGKTVGIRENLGKALDVAKYTFTDERGQSVKLTDFFGKKKPVLLTFAYYSCPNLCGVVLNAVAEAISGTALRVGQEYEVINVGIDPKEGFVLAQQKKQNFLKQFSAPAPVDAGWHFLTSPDNQVKAFADEVGFGYEWSESEKQYVHGAAAFILTPEGKISRILYGIDYRPSDVKLSLLEAGNGKIGTILDRILLFCYQYNPITRKYSIVITQLLKVAAIFTVLLLAGIIGLLYRTERKNRVVSFEQ